MSDETYNGWSNYETWVVALWLQNDEVDYKATKGLTANELTTYVWDMYDKYGLDKLQPSMFTDMINTSMAKVDWHEIADNFKDE